jgi:cytochrome c oxidase subunit IV
MGYTWRRNKQGYANKGAYLVIYVLVYGVYLVVSLVSLNVEFYNIQSALSRPMHPILRIVI